MYKTKEKTTEEADYITLKFDLLFKKVFGNPDDLIPIRYLLKNILNIEPKEITILNTELIGIPYKDKKIYVDLVVELEDGTKVSVEINTNTAQKYIDRNVYYMCRNMSKDLKVGLDFDKLNKHIQINMDFIGKHENPIMRYSLIEKETKELLTDIIEIIRIDIPYYKKACYNKDVSKLDSLTKLLGLFGTEKKELAKTLCEGDKNMEDIMKRIEEYNDDEDVIGAYDYEAKMRLIAEIEKEEAVKEGHEEGFNKGMEEGIEQGKLEDAKNMLKENIDINVISRVTGLSIEQIQNLDK